MEPPRRLRVGQWELFIFFFRPARLKTERAQAGLICDEVSRFRVAYQAKSIIGDMSWASLIQVAAFKLITLTLIFSCMMASHGRSRVPGSAPSSILDTGWRYRHCDLDKRSQKAKKVALAEHDSSNLKNKLQVDTPASGIPWNFISGNIPGTCQTTIWQPESYEWHIPGIYLAFGMLLRYWTSLSHELAKVVQTRISSTADISWKLSWFKRCHTRQSNEITSKWVSTYFQFSQC